MFLFQGGPGALLDGRGDFFQAIDKNSPSTDFMRNLQSMLQVKHKIPDIKSIVIFSAHWDEHQVTVDSTDGAAKLYYDYSGFPRELYAPYMTYPITTDIKLAERIHGMLNGAGVKNKLQPRREGFDHGSFIPLKLAFPESNIPIVQVSLKSNLDIADHIKIGEALAPLRDEGVLLIGAGALTHNLRALQPGSGISPRAQAFSDHMNELLTGLNEHNYEERKQQLIDVPSRAPHFAAMHPRAEHFIPLAVAFGAAIPRGVTSGGEPLPVTVRREFHEIVMGTFCSDSFVFS